MLCIADAAEIVKQPSWIAAQCFHILLSVATLILSVKFIFNLKKSTILNVSAVILLLLFTAFANLHAVMLLGIQIRELVNNALYTDTCHLTLKTSTCAIPNYVMMFCVMGMMLSQHILWLDRFFATFLAKFYRQWSKTLAVCLCLLTIATSILVPFILFHNDPYDDAVLTCLSTSAASDVKINRLFYSFIAMALLAITANVWLFVINRHKQKAFRFNVTHRFEAYENVLLTKWIGLVASVQFFFMTTYSLAIFLIRTRCRNSPNVTKQVIANWFYLVPLATLSLPLISLLVIHHSARKRMVSIRRMTSQRSDHMVHLVKMWS
ncbi:hypothetical protein KIN20_034706 [Parelaphostrongylus tenuis]|uniref:Uncharacterized protein n=1 Tax=Parelaphostrongylus tenuis TaxID=148309 RepID=A0AAD5WJX9_PARTN|nr:hypothetical protein KIN20_034706 [Parelaphostrongylus tenuis]